MPPIVSASTSPSPSPQASGALARAFRDQERFATGYAPLTARLFGLIGAWLEAEGALADPLVAWLATAAAGRQPFAVTNLLLAGLHRDVLANEPAAAGLARFYPTAGGDPELPGLEAALRQAIWQRRAALGDHLARANVQTNETGRGLAWLLPLSLTGWAAAHLVDLGASAGLNLLADRRRYRLEGSEGSVGVWGSAEVEQFVARVTGPLAAVCRQRQPLPRLLTRLGGDSHPFTLRDEADALSLQSFVWADHVGRLARLREAIAARRDYAGSFRLERVDLPQGLSGFLQRFLPPGREPVVLFNTVVTAYLPGGGAALTGAVEAWAPSAGRPVLWLQWEPGAGEADPSGTRYAWTLDAWSSAGRQRVRIGWVHPHGAEIELAEDFPSSVRFDKIH